MPKSQTKTVESDAKAALAFEFWLARGFHDGSPEEDMFRAMCANSMKVGARQPPWKRTETKTKAMGASVFVDS